MGSKSKLLAGVKPSSDTNIFCNVLNRIALLSVRNPFKIIATLFFLVLFAFYYLTVDITPSGIHSAPLIYVNANQTIHTLSPPDDNSTLIILKQFVLNSWNGKDMMTKEAILSVHAFQKMIENELNFCHCVSNSTSCFIKSPLDYWNNSVEILKSDNDIKGFIQVNHFYFLRNDKDYADRVVLSYAFHGSHYDDVIEWEQSIANLGKHKNGCLFPVFDGFSILRQTLIYKTLKKHVKNIYQVSIMEITSVDS